MDVKRLIEEVEKYPVLYDHKHEKYRNAEYKDGIWTDIASTLGVEGGPKACKSKWSVIRDHLLKTLRKRQQAAPWMEGRIPKKYKYEEYLQFLIPFYTLRDPFSKRIYFPDVDGEHDDELHMEMNQDESLLVPDVSVNIQEKREISPSHQNGRIIDIKQEDDRNVIRSSLQSPKEFIPSLLRRQNNLKKRVLRKGRRSLGLVTEQLMAYVLEEKAEGKRMKSVVENRNHNPVYSFLDGIAPSLASLNPVLLNQAKSKIFSIVQDYEMKQLELNQRPQATDYQNLPSL